MAADYDVFYRGYLTVTPLDKIFANGKRRWVTLSRTDPYVPASLELTYYADYHMIEKKGTFSLAKVSKIHPSFGKAKDHAFAVETKDKKVAFKAEEDVLRDIWVAKLYELCGTDHSCHVTIPNQPCISYSEGVLKLSAPVSVHIVHPSNRSSLLEIPLKDIRRFGYELAFDTDMLWFETCQCKLRQTNFIFFAVGSGTEKAQQVLYEIKSKLEHSTGALLIQEKSSETNISYISRSHYGCEAFSQVARDKAVQTGVFSLPRGWGGEYTLMKRRQSDYQVRMSGDAGSGRRNTVFTTPSIMAPEVSPSHSPHISPTHPPRRSVTPTPTRKSVSPPPPSSMTPSPQPRKKITLNDVGSNRGILKHSATVTEDSGVPLDQLDPSRYSAPCQRSCSPIRQYKGSGSAGADFLSYSTDGKKSLEQFRHGRRSIDMLGDRSRKVSGDRSRKVSGDRSRKVSGDRMAISLDGRSKSNGGKQVTLDQLYQRTIVDSDSKKNFPSKDSAFGDMEGEGYDHLGDKTSLYDQLSPETTSNGKHTIVSAQ